MQIPLIMDRYYEFYIERQFYYDLVYMGFEFVGIYRQGDGSLVFRHNYVKSRELFEVRITNNSQVINQTNVQSGSLLNITTCNMGDFYHDNAMRIFGLCMSDRYSRANYEIAVYPIFCRYDCPDNGNNNGGGDGGGGNDGGSCFTAPESNFRLWSNASMWPDGVVPTSFQNVTIKK